MLAEGASLSQLEAAFTFALRSDAAANRDSAPLTMTLHIAAADAPVLSLLDREGAVYGTAAYTENHEIAALHRANLDGYQLSVSDARFAIIGDNLVIKSGASFTTADTGIITISATRAGAETVTADFALTVTGDFAVTGLTLSLEVPADADFLYGLALTADEAARDYSISLPDYYSGIFTLVGNQLFVSPEFAGFTDDEIGSSIIVPLVIQRGSDKMTVHARVTVTEALNEVITKTSLILPTGTNAVETQSVKRDVPHRETRDDGTIVETQITTTTIMMTAGQGQIIRFVTETMVTTTPPDGTPSTQVTNVSSAPRFFFTSLAIAEDRPDFSFDFRPYIMAGNVDDVITFSLIEHDIFTISPAGLLTIKPGVELDYETTQSYVISLKIITNGDDSATADDAITISVPIAIANVNDAAPIFDENAPDTVLVGVWDGSIEAVYEARLGTSDAPMIYSLSGSDFFTINATTGALSIAEGVILSLGETYQLLVTATGPAGEQAHKQIAVIATTDAKANLAFNNIPDVDGILSVVDGLSIMAPADYSASFEQVDGANPAIVTYSLKGADAGLFRIDDKGIVTARLDGLVFDNDAPRRDAVGTETDFAITVVAQANGQRIERDVTIRPVDVRELTFTEDSPSIVRYNGLNLDSFQANFKAELLGVSEGVTYHIEPVSRDWTNLFTFNEQTGALRISSSAILNEQPVFRVIARLELEERDANGDRIVLTKSMRVESYERTNADDLVISFPSAVNERGTALSDDNDVIYLADSTANDGLVGNFAARFAHNAVNNNSTFFYRLSGADADSFTIDETGQLFIKDGALSQADTALSVRVVAYANGAVRALDLTVTNTPRAFPDTVPVTLILNEPDVGFEGIFTLPEIYQGYSYRLESSNAPVDINSIFAIDENGIVRVLTIPQAILDGNALWQMTIIASKGSDEIRVTVNVYGDNDIGDEALYFTRGADVPNVIAITDDNGFGSHNFRARIDQLIGGDIQYARSYELTGPDADLFAIDGKGQVTFVGDDFYENHVQNYQFTVNARYFGTVLRHDVTVTTNAGFEGPVFDVILVGVSDRSIEANFTLANADGTLTYAITSLDETDSANLFAIAANGDLSVQSGAALAQGSYHLRITATDAANNSYHHDVEVRVVPDAELPQFALQSDYAPDLFNGAHVLFITDGNGLGVRDFDARFEGEEAANYSLSGRDADSFTITDTGVLTYNGDLTAFNAALTATYELTITAHLYGQEVMHNLIIAGTAGIVNADDNGPVATNLRLYTASRNGSFDNRHEVHSYKVPEVYGAYSLTIVNDNFGNDIAHRLAASTDGNEISLSFHNPRNESIRGDLYRFDVIATPSDGGPAIRLENVSFHDRSNSNPRFQDRPDNASGQLIITGDDGFGVQNYRVFIIGNNVATYYELDGPDAARFTISNDGQLRFNGTDESFYEGIGDGYNITIIADSHGAILSRPITILHAPLVESSTAGFLVIDIGEEDDFLVQYSVTAHTDVTFALENTSADTDVADILTISETGQLLIKQDASLINGLVYRFDVLVTDENGAITRVSEQLQIFTDFVNRFINVPDDDGLLVVSLDEEFGVQNYQVTAFSNNLPSEGSYEVRGADAGLFAISTTGRLSFIGSDAAYRAGLENGGFDITIGRYRNAHNLEHDLKIRVAPEFAVTDTAFNTAVIAIGEDRSFDAAYHVTSYNGAVTYSLENRGTADALSAFAIDGTTGVLSLIAAQTAPLAASYEFTIVARDEEGLETRHEVTARTDAGLPDFDDRPGTIFEGDIIISITGRAAFGTQDFSISFDGIDASSYSLSGKQAGAFTISDAGIMTFTGTNAHFQEGLDTGGYQLTLTATIAGQEITEDIIIGRAPTFDDEVLASLFVSEADRTIEANFAASSQAGDVTYSIRHNSTVPVFGIDEEGDLFILEEAPDLTTIISSQTFDVIVTAPDGTQISYNVSWIVVSNLPDFHGNTPDNNGLLVIDAADGFGTKAYHITYASGVPDNNSRYSLSGTHANFFAISNSGQLTYVGTDGDIYADFDGQDLQLTVEGHLFGQIVTRDLTIRVADKLPEFPDALPHQLSLIEGQIFGPFDVTAIAPAGVAAADITYALSGSEARYFALDPATNQLSLRADPNYEFRGYYEVTITATANGFSATHDLILRVHDVDEAPTAAETVLLTLPSRGETALSGALQDSFLAQLNYQDPDIYSELSQAIVDAGGARAGHPMAGIIIHSFDADFTNTLSLQLRIGDNVTNLNKGDFVSFDQLSQLIITPKDGITPAGFVASFQIRAAQIDPVAKQPYTLETDSVTVGIIVPAVPLYLSVTHNILGDLDLSSALIVSEIETTLSRADYDFTILGGDSRFTIQDGTLRIVEDAVFDPALGASITIQATPKDINAGLASYQADYHLLGTQWPFAFTDTHNIAVTEGSSSADVSYQIYDEALADVAVIRWALTGTDAGLFEISETGLLTFKDRFDFAFDGVFTGVYDLAIEATVEFIRGATYIVSADVQVTVTDDLSNNVASFDNATSLPSAIVITENATEFNVGSDRLTSLDFGATPQTPGASVTYRLAGDGAAYFEISADGILTVKPGGLDFETVGDFVELSVLATPVSGTNTQRPLRHLIKVTIEDVPPYTGQFVNAPSRFDDVAREGFSHRFTFETDGAQPVRYALEGDDADLFTISSRGLLRAKDDLDGRTYDVTIVAFVGVETETERSKYTHDVTIIVPPVIFTNATRNLLLQDDLPFEAIFGARGPEGQSVRDFVLSGPDASKFSISNRGVLTWKAGAFNYEAEAETANLQVSITATYESDTATIDLTIIPVDIQHIRISTPEIIRPASLGFDNFDFGIMGGIFGSYDNVDQSSRFEEMVLPHQLKFSLSGGDSDYFTIDQTTGYVSASDGFVPTYSASKSYYSFDLTVSSRDDTETHTQTVYISDAANQLPTIVAAQARMIESPSDSVTSFDVPIADIRAFYSDAPNVAGRNGDALTAIHITGFSNIQYGRFMIGEGTLAQAVQSGDRLNIEQLATLHFVHSADAPRDESYDISLSFTLEDERGGISETAATLRYSVFNVEPIAEIDREDTLDGLVVATLPSIGYEDYSFTLDDTRFVVDGTQIKVAAGAVIAPSVTSLSLTITGTSTDATDATLSKVISFAIVSGNNFLSVRPTYTPGETLLFGTEGDDILTASRSNTAFDGKGGNDTINGSNGHAFIIGGTGDDVIHLGQLSQSNIVYRLESATTDNTVSFTDGSDVIHNFQLAGFYADKLLFVDTNSAGLNARDALEAQNITVDFLKSGDDFTGFTLTSGAETLTVNLHTDAYLTGADATNLQAAIDDNSISDITALLDHILSDTVFDITTDTSPSGINVL